MTGTARERLKAWRKENKVSQEALAEMVGVGQTTISNLEKDERNPGLALGLSIELVTGIKASLWPKPKKGRAA
jgi:transcriptional regulator with XRE-family HTH domain